MIKLCEDSRFQDRDLNPEAIKHEAGAPTDEPRLPFVFTQALSHEDVWGAFLTSTPDGGYQHYLVKLPPGLEPTA
jgi:hypothetical protein